MQSVARWHALSPVMERRSFLPDALSPSWMIARYTRRPANVYGACQSHECHVRGIPYRSGQRHPAQAAANESGSRERCGNDGFRSGQRDDGNFCERNLRIALRLGASATPSGTRLSILTDGQKVGSSCRSRAFSFDLPAKRKKWFRQRRMKCDL